MKKFSWRGLSIALFVCVTAFYLAPLAIPNLPDWWASKKLKLGLDLKGGMQILLEIDNSQNKLTQEEVKSALDQNIMIIRDRIDQFGVAEPIIQKMGNDRIMVQLPGVSNFEAAEKLIRQSAILEFKLVATDENAAQVLQAIDGAVTQNLNRFPALAKLAKEDQKALAKADSTKADSLKQSKGVFASLIHQSDGGYKVQYDSVDMLQKVLADSTFKALMPAGFQISLGKPDSQNPKDDRDIYVLLSEAELTGADLAKAKVEIGSSSSTDIKIANKPYISMSLKRSGAQKFETVTGDNIQRRLAIVMDSMVYSAPMIQDRISGGNAQITGSFTQQEAQDLVIVLNTGNLVAPIKPINTVIVGATLGEDSIASGKLAGIVGILLVAFFMILYYKVSGLLADVALIFNVGFILAMLTALGATLTLPGIAGIILTIGMAVDANVLIFERIREELLIGKTPRSAHDAGYKRAAVTIWDSQITTLIAAAVLYNFGSGPIRGFAVTLALGIVGSIFCAIVFVRWMTDTFILTGVKKNLSI